MIRKKILNPTSSLREGFDDVGTPDMKYYAFDWDDNIMMMPTKIIVKDENYFNTIYPPLKVGYIDFSTADPERVNIHVAPIPVSS
jgi:hypothetical protein